ncbi:MAG: hypothetical protein U1F27_10160 [Turneriella sp.]
MTLLASFVWGAKPDNKVAGASEKDAAVKAEHSSSSLPTRNIFAFVEGVVHKEFYYRTIRAGFQPWERFSFFIERADYQTPLPGDYNRNAVGANWHLPALHERLGVILSGAFNLANGTRQWVPVTDLALLVKFRLFWRLHVFAQTRNYFYRNAVLDEFCCRPAHRAIVPSGIECCAGVPNVRIFISGRAVADWLRKPRWNMRITSKLPMAVLFLVACADSPFDTLYDDDFRFKSPMLSYSDLTSVIPMGNMNPPSHTVPTDHMYFYHSTTSPRAGVPVLAPADGLVTKTFSADYGESKVWVHCAAGFEYYVDHVVLDSGIRPGTAFKSGARIGQTSGYAYGVDLGLVNAKRTVTGLVQPDRYPSETQHADSPLAYFEQSVFDQLAAYSVQSAPMFGPL